jgi:hypothetical protein
MEAREAGNTLVRVVFRMISECFSIEVDKVTRETSIESNNEGQRENLFNVLNGLFGITVADEDREDIRNAGEFIRYAGGAIARVMVHS